MAGAGEVALGKADHHEAHAAALALDDGVGGQRGRHRHHADIRRRDLARRHDGVERRANAEREIVPGGQRLGLGQHARGLVEQHRVRIGPGGFDADQLVHGKSRLLAKGLA